MRLADMKRNEANTRARLKTLAKRSESSDSAG